MTVNTCGNFFTFWRSITDPWEKWMEDCKKKKRKAATSFSQWRFNSFGSFTPFGATLVSGKAHMPQWVWDDTISHQRERDCVCVCVCLCLGFMPPLQLWAPFRLLSPHQPTFTWLRPLGYFLMRIDVFATHTHIDTHTCLEVWHQKERGRKGRRVNEGEEERKQCQKKPNTH